MSALLEVRDVARSFGGVRAVDAASFDVVAGSITALIGPNGAGKSSLFNIISGFLRPEHGHGPLLRATRSSAARRTESRRPGSSARSRPRAR